MTKKRKRKDPSRLYTQGNWPKDRPENPCKVFSFLDKWTQANLEQHILDALYRVEGPKFYKAIWLPDLPEYEIPIDTIEGLPVKYTSWNRGGSLGIWLEQVDISPKLD